MTDTKSLRNRITAQLEHLQAEVAELQRRLQALDLVEQMERELAPAESDDDDDATLRDGTLIKACYDAADEQYRKVSELVPRVVELYPSAGRSAISTAYMRLFTKGLLEKKGGTDKHTDPAQYRRKAA